MTRKFSASFYLLALILGISQLAWAQEPASGVTDAEAEKLVREAESAKATAFSANQQCKFDERDAARRRIHEIYETLRSAGNQNAREQVFWIQRDVWEKIRVLKECEHLVMQRYRPADYRSADERQERPYQGETYSGLADRLHWQVTDAINRCDLARAQESMAELNSLSYDAGGLRRSTTRAPREADRQVQAAIEHIQARADQAYDLFQRNRERCEQVEAERGIKRTADSAALILKLTDKVERNLAEAEAAKSRIDCEMFDKSVNSAFNDIWYLKYQTFYGKEQSGQMAGYLRRLDQLRAWNCHDEREKRAKEDILSEVHEPAAAAAEGSPWDQPNPDSPWDNPNPESPWDDKHAPNETAPASPAAAGKSAAAYIPGMVTLEWHRDEYGLNEADTFYCPPNPERRFSSASLYGTDRYLRKSTVCVAAAHAGVITVEGGGAFRLKFFAGKPGDHYEGTERNGITSQSWDRSWGGFTIVPIE